MKIKALIESLPVYEMPKRYKWRDKEAISLQDIGFPNVCDCLNKRYTTDCEPFPADFDSMQLYRILGGHLKQTWLHTLVDPDPNFIIVGQRFLKKKRLLEMIDKPVFTPIRGARVGKYTIIHDGHHRLALRYLRKIPIYGRIKSWSYENE